MRRKRKFHGNRFTNSKNYNNRGFVDGESSSPLLDDEISSSNTRVELTMKQKNVCLHLTES